MTYSSNRFAAIENIRVYLLGIHMSNGVGPLPVLGYLRGGYLGESSSTVGGSLSSLLQLHFLYN
jgi:hypothetical protein